MEGSFKKQTLASKVIVSALKLISLFPALI